MFRLDTRRLEPELMDQPDLAEREHKRALSGLARLNGWSRTTPVLWQALLALARAQGLSTLRVLDLATGGGETPLRLWRCARKSGLLDLRIDGCDINPGAVAHAREKADGFGADCRFFVLDATSDALPRDYDVMLCSLFLHHLREEEAVALMGRMREAARRMVLVDDLQRRPAGMAIAYAGTRALGWSRVVRVDGLRSVAAAFTMDEAASLARAAGLDGAHITPHWPFRFLLSWSHCDQPGSLTT